MKKTHTIFILVVTLFLGTANLFAQTSAVVNWQLVGDRQATITGNVDADSVLGFGGLTVKTYNTSSVLPGPLGPNQSQWYLGKDASGKQYSWPLNNTDDQIDSLYVEFVVSPKAGYDLTVDSVKGWIGGMGTNNMRANVYFGGTDTAFATLQQLNTSIFMLKQFSYYTSNPMDTAYAYGVNFTVKNGEKFRFRIYPWYKSSSASNSKYFLMQNVSISGTTTPATSVESVDQIPTEFSLAQNYPNPFNPSTNISYSLNKAGMTKLTVYNIIGQEITTLVNDYKNAGNYSVTFNATNLPSGMYIYRLISGEQSMTRKMLLIK